MFWLDYQFSSVQSFSCVRLFATPWIAAHQASLSVTNSQSSLRLTSIESVMPSSHLILCHLLLLLPPIPPSIRVFSNESTLCMRWPKYWSFSFSTIPSKEIQGWSPSEWTAVPNKHSWDKLNENSATWDAKWAGRVLLTWNQNHNHRRKLWWKFALNISGERSA